MGDWGLKISKEDKDVNTSVLADTSFDSRYSSLMLIEKKVITWTAPQGEDSPSGTETYAHGLGFAPFVIARLDFVAGPTEYNNQPITYNYSDQPGGAFSGASLFSYITVESTTTNIEVDWQTIESVSGSSQVLSDDVDYTVTLHIYGFSLGTEVNEL